MGLRTKRVAWNAAPGVCGVDVVQRPALRLVWPSGSRCLINSLLKCTDHHVSGDLFFCGGRMSTRMLIPLIRIDHCRCVLASFKEFKLLGLTQSAGPYVLQAGKVPVGSFVFD